MNQVVSKSIVLRRTNYGESDRILTLLSETNGKISVIAKGARKLKSKLASGIELFSESEIVFITGKSNLHTLRSAKLLSQWMNIAKDLDRSDAAFDMLKVIHKIVEEHEGADLYPLLRNSLVALDTLVSPEKAQLWFAMQIVNSTGHSPNLQTDVAGQKLDQTKTYSFLVDQGTLQEDTRGEINANCIKIMRLALATDVATFSKVNSEARELQIAKQTIWGFMKFSLHL